MFRNGDKVLTEFGPGTIMERENLPGLSVPRYRVLMDSLPCKNYFHDKQQGLYISKNELKPFQ